MGSKKLDYYKQDNNKSKIENKKSEIIRKLTKMLKEDAMIKEDYLSTLKSIQDTVNQNTALIGEAIDKPV